MSSNIKKGVLFYSIEGGAPIKFTEFNVGTKRDYNVDVYGDWISDGITKTKIASFKFSLDGNPQPNVPKADAGPDKVMDSIGQEITLGGPNSSTGQGIKYQWRFSKGPPIPLVVEGINLPQCKFKVPQEVLAYEQDFEFILTVINELGNIDTDTVVVKDNIPLPDQLTANLEAPTEANVSQIVVLNGSRSRLAESHTLTQEDSSGITVNLQPHPNLPMSYQFTATQEMVGKTLGFRLEVKRGTEIKQVSVQILIKSTPQPGNFPVAVNWVYSSDPALENDIRLPSGRPHPQDKVLFSSSASGVSSHSVVNKWLEIESGGGNGRVYWNYHEVPEFANTPEAGFCIAMTGIFKWGGYANLSIKDGNHGTNGWVFDSRLKFGGFGLSLHATEIQSKVEYWHNSQGSEVARSYPNGLRFNNGGTYKYFVTMATDRANNAVVLNAWVDFGTADGWVLVMQNRTWKKDSDWRPGSVPSGDDRQQILDGPGKIKRHHIWTRCNSGGRCPIQKVEIGFVPFIS